LGSSIIIPIHKLLDFQKIAELKKISYVIKPDSASFDFVMPVPSFPSHSKV